MGELDWILLIGGALFFALGVVSYVRKDWVWQLYSYDPRWRERNPERTPAWDSQTQRYGFYFLLIGAIAVLLSFGI